MELNKELLEKAKEMKTPEELLAFAKENGIEMTKEKADAYFKQLGTSSGNIADDELENVSGGKFDEMEDQKLPPPGLDMPELWQIYSENHYGLSTAETQMPVLPVDNKHRSGKS